jgi:hypothetical protein
MVERRDQHPAGFLDDFCGDAFALTCLAQHHLGAVAAGGVHLDGRRLLRHDDVRRNSIDRRRIGHGLGMVSARVGDHSAGPDRLVEVADRVERAANLERPDSLQIFRLDPQGTVLVGP